MLIRLFLSVCLALAMLCGAAHSVHAAPLSPCTVTHA